MPKYLSNIINSIKEYHNYVFLTVVTMGIVVPFYFHITRISYMHKMETQLSTLYTHLKEDEYYNKLSITPELLMCETINCFGYEKNGVLIKVGDVDVKTHNNYKTLTVIENMRDFNIPWYEKPFVYDIKIGIKGEKPIIYKKSFFKFFIADLKYFLLIQSFIVIMTLYVFNLLARKEKDIYKFVSDKESSLLNSIMTIYITENLHHELLTPVKVIMTKNRVLNNTLQNVLNNKTDKDNTFFISDIEIIKSKESLEYIEMSVEQIHSVLQNMRDAKIIKKGTNQSIYDMVEHAIGLMDLITSDEFEYEIDEEFDKFKIGNTLATGSFLNILLNHIKNSIEASSDNIQFVFKGFNGEQILLHIIDDGNGIPEETLKKLFGANNSYKTQSDEVIGSIRGNGLFLNKSIINRSDGDIKLVKTDMYGTTFELIIPVIEINI